MSGELDETALEPVLPRLPRQIEGIDWDAVTAKTRSRVERHETERLSACGLDDFPDVDIHPVRHQRDFVDQTDVDRAERVLEQLDHLGDLRRADGHNRADDRAVQLLGELGADLVHTANDFRDRPRRVGGIPRINAFGRERQVKVLPRFETTFLERRLDDLVRRTWVGRRFKDDELAWLEPRTYRVDREHNIGQIR